MSLISQFLPEYQFSEVHSTTIQAEPGRLLDLVFEQDAQADPFIKRLVALRELPDRLAGALGLRTALKQRPAFGLQDFTFLGRDGDREVAFGLAGEFWRSGYGLRHPASAEAFAALAEPGVAKLVMNFVAEPGPQGTRLTTRTHVFCPDEAARRRFLPYWLLIRLPSGFIRRRILRRLKQQAEMQARER